MTSAERVRRDDASRHGRRDAAPGDRDSGAPGEKPAPAAHLGTGEQDIAPFTSITLAGGDTRGARGLGPGSSLTPSNNREHGATTGLRRTGRSTTSAGRGHCLRAGQAAKRRTTCWPAGTGVRRTIVSMNWWKACRCRPRVSRSPRLGQRVEAGVAETPVPRRRRPRPSDPDWQPSFREIPAKLMDVVSNAASTHESASPSAFARRSGRAGSGVSMLPSLG